MIEGSGLGLILINYGISLVGGLEQFLFFHIFKMIIPIDSYFSDRLKPSTSSLVYVISALDLTHFTIWIKETPPIDR